MFCNVNDINNFRATTVNHITTLKIIDQWVIGDWVWGHIAIYKLFVAVNFIASSIPLNMSLCSLQRLQFRFPWGIFSCTLNVHYAIQWSFDVRFYYVFVWVEFIMCVFQLCWWFVPRNSSDRSSNRLPVIFSFRMRLTLFRCVYVLYKLKSQLVLCRCFFFVHVST